MDNNFLYDPRFHRFADFLGIDKYQRDDPHVFEKITFIYDWAMESSKNGALIDVLNNVTQLKKSLGTTLRGQELLSEMYQWMRLDLETNRLMAEKKAREAKLKEREEVKTELQDRVLKRAKDWEDQKSSELEKSQQAQEQASKYAEKQSKQIKQEAKQQKELSLTLG